MTKVEQLRSTPASVLRMQRGQMTVARMAEQYGVSADTVYKVLRAHGIRGTHSTAKLSSAKVRAIRQKYAKTRNASALAREYGVNPSTIRGIVRGDYWKWVK